ncbi:MAG: hypothetical protein GC129_05515 [Proteobacteria bacterium]|nr:hypothetical protein [Pseudomonadota bacterium]
METVLDSVRFLRATQDDKEFQQEIVREFRASSAESLQLLANLEAPLPDWMAAGHRLKGAAANLGGMKLASLCERAQHATPATDRQALAEAIIGAYNELTVAFTALLESPRSLVV